jgi:Tfp pilus assembly protein PilF
MPHSNTAAILRAVHRELVSGDAARAEAMLAAPIAASPHDPDLLALWGNCALVRGDDDAALDRYARALRAAPDSVPLLVNVGFIHRRRHRIGEARAVLERCVAIAPANEEAWVNLTATYVNEGEARRGAEAARAALAHHPASAMIRWNLALVLLEQGFWEEGWREYRHRFAAGVVSRREYGTGPAPRRLEALDDICPGQTIACHGEQGIGDELLFAGMIGECADAVASRGGRLVLDPRRRLRGALGRSFGLPLVSRDGRGALHGPAPDWVIPSGDLGGFFRPADERFPRRGQYLRVDPARVAEIRRDLDSRAGARALVGLAWSGGSSYTLASVRRVPLAEWSPLFDLPVRVVALEYRDPAEEITAFTAGHGRDLEHLPHLAAADDYDDVLHLVAALDLVVTVPTSVLHAAGALGVPCRVVMHERAAWRECSRDDTLPWYPSTHRRFVRPAADDSWSPTIRRVVADVAASLQSGVRRLP